MKKVSVFLAALLAVTVLFGGAMPAKAASAEVGIEIKATDVNVAVTVPSQVPIVFNEDGSNTYPINWSITNDGIARMRVSRIDARANGSGWNITGPETNVSTLPANTKTIQLYIGESNNKATLYPDNGYTDDEALCLFFGSAMNIPAGESLIVDFEIVRGAFTESASMSKAFDLEFTFEFV